MAKKDDVFDVYHHIKLLGKDYRLLSKRRLKKAYRKLKTQSSQDAETILAQKIRIRFNEERVRDLIEKNNNCQEYISSLLEENNGIKHDICDSQMLISNMNQEIAYKKEYMGDQWCTGWIEFWKEYFYENNGIINEKIKRIKEGVDETSKNTIDILLMRNKNIFPIQKYTNYYLYNYELIYEEWEKKGQREGLPENTIREKYGIDDGVYLETPVFKFHCGLCCLPTEATALVKGRDIIDGGAFWGDSALVFNEYNPRSIHAFEPLRENFNRLISLKDNRKIEKLHPNNCGLGEHAETKTLYYHEIYSGASVIDYKALFWERENSSQESITLIAIDDYVKEHDLDVGVIKLDIEGNELEAIKGAIETIKKYKPILLISVYHLPKDLFEIKPLLESLNLGYQFMFRKLVFHDPLTEVSLIGYVL